MIPLVKEQHMYMLSLICVTIHIVHVILMHTSVYENKLSGRT